ncbi:D-cysteine desulfhydrase [Citrobacter koseri]|nr:D-cysteine desulfhydrase [Citrobacter koseri]
MCDALTDPDAQLQELATHIEAQGFRPYVIPVGGSSPLGAMGYVESALEIAQQCEGAVQLSSRGVGVGKRRYARRAGGRSGTTDARC